jgi:hypothetical protein
MISEDAVLRHAWQMLRASGAAAQQEAVDYARSLAAKGDEAGSDLWLRVAEAVGRLQRPAASGTAHETSER